MTVATGGTLDLTAATRVVLDDGFVVEDGASLTAGTDSSILYEETKTYDYKDTHHFLTFAEGPWGTLEWTYDRIGNRISETRNGFTDTYAYTSNGTGNTALLEQITLAAGAGTRDFAYTAAGHQREVDSNGNVVTFTYDEAGRIALASRNSGDTSPFEYDGRSYLRQAGNLAETGTVQPTYDSAGLLHLLLRLNDVEATPVRYHVFYLAGRAVGQLATESGQADRWWYFTTDQLGTPVVATGDQGEALWQDAFEPFGRDVAGGIAEGALASEIYLRFPGQWDDEVWQVATMGAEVSYNVYRWYAPNTSRYSRPDPLGIVAGDMNPYHYALSNPIVYIDEFGLATFKNFPAGKQEEAERALQEALQKLKDQPCCTGSQELTKELQAKLSDPDLVIVYKPQLKACGQTPFMANVFGSLRMQLGPLAFDPARCCDLASTMVHEASHIGLGGSESDARQIEKDCFNCPRGR